MKKICIFLLVILVVVLLLQGCTETKLDYGSRIIPPNNKIIPINGTWMINKFENSGEKVRIYKDDTQWIGKMVVFNEKSVVVGEEICEEAHYKVKSVKAKDYFLFRHRIRVEELKIQDQMIDIISVSSDDKPFYDFIKLDNAHAMVYLEDGLFSMEKISDDSNKNILVHNEAESAQTEEPLPPDPELLRSGILLGLRAKPFSGNGRTVYRTLWIASHNRTLHPVLETPNLFIPRKDGFWRMEVKKKKVNDFIQDALVVYPMDQDFRQNSGLENQQIEEGHVQNTILFVGDDYVAIESTNSFHDNTQFISRYKMLPIDNAQSNMGVKLSEIEGEKAKEIFDKSAEAFLLSQTKEIENIETVIDESNFTMARRNGHWI